MSSTLYMYVLDVGVNVKAADADDAKADADNHVLTQKMRQKGGGGCDDNDTF